MRQHKQKVAPILGSVKARLRRHPFCSGLLVGYGLLCMVGVATSMVLGQGVAALIIMLLVVGFPVPVAAAGYLLSSERKGALKARSPRSHFRYIVFD